jgi:hypothetical protein
LVVRRWSLAFRERRTTKDERRGFGAVAQLGERLVCNQEATGSIPVSSTRIFPLEESMESILELRGLLVPIVAVIVGGAIAITTLILKHQERIAKIERGIDPDAPPRS